LVGWWQCGQIEIGGAALWYLMSHLPVQQLPYLHVVVLGLCMSMV
jgi:hypothetical protein